MSSPEAAGERLIAADQFMWMTDIAEVLRERLGDRAAKVPTRIVPNLLVRAMSVFDSDLRSFTGDLGQRRIVFSTTRRDPARLVAASESRRRSWTPPRASSTRKPAWRRLAEQRRVEEEQAGGLVGPCPNSRP